MLSVGKVISTVQDFSDSVTVQKQNQFLKRKYSFGGDVEKTTTMNLFCQNKSDFRELVTIFNDSPSVLLPVKTSSPPPPDPNPIQKSQSFDHQRKFEAGILPMTRRVTLSKFLGKRKDRMMASAPYR